MKKLLIFTLSLALVYGFAVPVSAQSNSSECSTKPEDYVFYITPEYTPPFVAKGGDGVSVPEPTGSDPVITINNDEFLTDTPEVTLTFNIRYADEMLVSNDAGFRDAAWQPYQPVIENWRIYTDPGSQYVYVMFRNAYGTTDVYKDQIFYQTTNSGGRKTLQDWLALNCFYKELEKNNQDKLSLLAKKYPQLPADLRPGDLVKSSTGAIYYIGSDHKRHLYPTIKEYDSWNQGYGAVQTVSDEVLSQIRLGKNMTVRPGTYLVKIQSDPKVYAVDKNNTLRWITSESIAVNLYGPNWAHRVIDLLPTQMADYTLGEPITSSEYPQGTILKTKNGEVYRYENGSFRVVDDSGYLYNDYQDRFVVEVDSLPVNAVINDNPVVNWEEFSLPAQTYYPEDFPELS